MDKQIIIDGVDVSECKKLMQGIVPFGCMEDRKTCGCKYNPNCHYKQLKRKEQECEELKKTIMYKCPQCGDEYLSPIGASLYEENYKLKQTITDIKEIAEPFCNACQEHEPEKRDRDCMYCNYGKILQKNQRI